jgi:hypothetical protein
MEMTMNKAVRLVRIILGGPIALVGLGLFIISIGVMYVGCALANGNDSALLLIRRLLVDIATSIVPTRK